MTEYAKVFNDFLDKIGLDKEGNPTRKAGERITRETDEYIIRPNPDGVEVESDGFRYKYGESTSVRMKEFKAGLERIAGSILGYEVTLHADIQECYYSYILS